MKKILCLVLSVVFILSCLSVYGFAEDSDGSTNTESSVCITEMSPVDPSSKEIKLAAYQSRPIIISVLPTDAKDLVSWSVADKTIARVSADGVVTGKKAGKTTVTVAAADGSRKKITYKVTVTARQPGNNLSTESCTVVNTQKSKYTYDQMCKDLKILKQTYPYLLDYVSLGKTYDNREIYEIVIGNKDSKNKIFVQSTIHAREYINSMLVMEQVEALCANYYSGSYRGKYYSELLENCCFYIVPMSNPDGVAISTKGADGIRDNTLRSKVIKMYKKYGEGKSSYYTKWKANARGVDLNRNWDCNWKSKKTVTYACSEGYKGSSPVSEKETKILKNEVETLKPKAIISYHSNGSVIYWDFIQTGSLQRKCSDLFKVTKGLTGYASAENPSAHGGTTADLGPCFGDWVANTLNITTLTIETGDVDCPIPVKYFPDIWKQNQHILPALAYFVLNDTAVGVASLKASSKGFTVNFNPSKTKNIRFQIEYSVNSNFKDSQKVIVPGSDSSLKVTKLKGNKTYYVRIRPIKKYGSLNIYGRWSSKKSVQTKK